jgi:replicative DNA helicase
MGEQIAGRGVKVAPHNIEAERVLLGAILMDNTALDAVEFLDPSHFFDPGHRKLFEGMRAAIRAGKLVQLDTVKSILSLPATMPVAGTTMDFYLLDLNGAGCSPASAGEYGRQIRDLAVRRDLIALSEDIAKDAYAAPADATARTHIEDIEKKLYTLADTVGSVAGFVPFSETLARAIKNAHDAYQRGGDWPACPPGCMTWMARSAACSGPTSSSSRAAPAWARPPWPPGSPTTSRERGLAPSATTARGKPGPADGSDFFRAK